LGPSLSLYPVMCTKPPDVEAWRPAGRPDAGAVPAWPPECALAAAALADVEVAVGVDVHPHNMTMPASAAMADATMSGFLCITGSS
jgi:hypothetical protein